MFVQELVSDATIEALDARILIRLPGLDEMQIDVRLGAPGEHLCARKFGAVVGFDRRGQNSLRCNAIERTNNALAREREIGLDSDAFSSEVVNDR